jgi:DNA invertase Pin-like site-specific DNA recombinase
MTAKPGSPAVAFSYIRFSTPEQRRGDSLRRQTEAAQAWCDRNNARLDASTTLHDLGTSAFRGSHRKNPDRNALAAFLKLVEDEKVERGSFLIIESLDRLTREHIRPALTLLLNLIEHGVRIVQLKPVEVVYDEDVEPMTLMMALMELSRGNSESRIKSDRIGAAYRNKRVQARESELIVGRTHTRTGKLLTSCLPAWVKVVNIEKDRYTLALIPERAKIVQRVFALASQGLGLLRVVQKLADDKVPAFGRLLSEEQIARYDDRRREQGKPVTEEERLALRRPGYWYKGRWLGARWNKSYVHSLLADRRALGEYLPLSRAGGATNRKPEGPPIKDYFPAVVDEATWTAARAAMTVRKPLHGRRVGKHIELFSRLVIDALDGSPYYTATHTETKKDGSKRRWRSLVSSSSGQGRGSKRSFPLPTFERAILSALREVDPCEVLGESSPAAEVAALERQYRWIADRQADLAAELRNGDIPVIAQQLRELKAEQDEVAAKLDEAQQLAAKPLSQTWCDIAALLDKAADPDARRRLRSAISRVVEDIQLLVVRQGRDQLAAVQVNFAGGEARRNYLIFHRPVQWVGNGLGGKLRPGRWWAGAVKHPDDGLPFNQWDLRPVDHPERLKDPDDPECGVDYAELMQGFLENYPQDIIEGALKEGHPLP